MSSEFRTPVDLRIVLGGFEVLSEIRYYSAYLDKEVVIPKGYFTDLASVPWYGRWLVPTTTGKNREAAVVHDFLCDDEVQASFGITQIDTDAVWREALGVLKVNVVYRWGLWIPVRSFQFIKGIVR